MLPFHRILFPVDYSEPCRAVIPYVQEMACHFSAELTVCHAYAPLSAIAHSELLITDPGLQEKAHAIEEDRLRQFACQAFASQQVGAIAELGEPGTVIDRLAEQQRADLVMLATRGHSVMRRFLLGSITSKVLHDVSCAVWPASDQRCWIIPREFLINPSSAPWTIVKKLRECCARPPPSPPLIGRNCGSFMWCPRHRSEEH